MSAVLPLFARQGCAVTTRELAAACGVSEALIFRHFPSKEALYEEILTRYQARIEPVVVCVAREMEPSTENLVKLIYLFIRMVAIREPSLEDPTLALYYRSFTEDGVFAKRFLKQLMPAVHTALEASLRHARETGDARDNGIPPENLSWFVQHLATASCMVRLQSPPVVRYKGRIDQNVIEMTSFALAGLGLKEAVIQKYANADSFKQWRQYEKTALKRLRDKIADDADPENGTCSG